MKKLLPCIVFSFALIACQATAQQDSSGDPLTGTWVGWFGNGAYDRNTISLELKWDGENVTGAIKPGLPNGRMYKNFEPFPIEKASFDPRAGIIKFEALFEPRGRHYVIEGKLNRKVMSGTWDRPEDRRNGDFSLTRQTNGD